MSAFGLHPDMCAKGNKGPLMTQSGHWQNVDPGAQPTGQSPRMTFNRDLLTFRWAL